MSEGHRTTPPAVPRFGRYPEYRDSGVELLGEIPAHWKVQRLGAIGRITKCSGGTKAHEVDEGIPCVRYGDLYTYHDTSITRSRTCVSPEHSGRYSTIRYGDLLFAASGEMIDEIGTCAVNLMDGEAVCGGDVILLRSVIPMDARFLGYAANAPYMVHQKSRLGRGMTVMHIYGRQLKDVVMLLPPVSEQRSIADFVGRETAKIDELVTQQEQLIDLMQEKRAALITRAVTCGLDSDVPMKESGVEWLHEIPAHWDTKKIKRLFGNTKRQGFPDLTVLSVYREYGVIEKASRDDNFNRTPENLDVYQLVNPGDLVINKMKAWQGSLGVSALSGITSPDYLVYAPDHDVNERFLHHFLRCKLLTGVYLTMSNGIRPSQWRLERERFDDFAVFLPPSAEQDQIAAFLDRETAKIDAVISRVRQTINLLQECRLSLISAAVTGRIDVRERAA